jgi:hypothetical protein
MEKKIKKLNDGEREEYLIKIKLCFLRDNQQEVNNIGKIERVGFVEEYNSINWTKIDFEKIKNNQKDIKRIAKELGISKSSSRDKADVKINDIYYSLKCNGYGKPTIVNHTNRKGWLKIAELKKLKISKLDEIINQYWKLRINGDITEDCPNFHQKSPFKKNKEIIKPYLDFFIFEGSGQGYSEYPVTKVLEFKSFKNLSSWKIYGNEYLDQHWNNLYFCVRSTKGMPKNYDTYEYKKLLSPWTRNFKGSKGDKKHRGALHVRVG